MLTTNEAADVLNLVEESAVNSLENDSWLQTGGTGGIGLIHRRTLRSDRFYQAHELPALRIGSTQVEPAGSTSPAGARNVGTRVIVEAFVAGADHESLIQSLKTIAARLQLWWCDQETLGGNRLDGLLDDGDGVVFPATVTVRDETKGDRLYRAAAKLETTVGFRASTT